MTIKGSHLLYILGVLVLAGVATYGWTNRTPSPHSEALSCVSSIQEQCASEDFLRSYSRWAILRNKLGTSDGSETVVQREQVSDEFSGLTTRLSGMVPKNYQWDEVKRRFVPVQIPQATAPAAMPNVVPAPVAAPPANAPKK